MDTLQSIVDANLAARAEQRRQEEIEKQAQQNALIAEFQQDIRSYLAILPLLDGRFTWNEEYGRPAMHFAFHGEWMVLLSQSSQRSYVAISPDKREIYLSDWTGTSENSLLINALADWVERKDAAGSQKEATYRQAILEEPAKYYRLEDDAETVSAPKHSDIEEAAITLYNLTRNMVLFQWGSFHLNGGPANDSQERWYWMGTWIQQFGEAVRNAGATLAVAGLIEPEPPDAPRFDEDTLTFRYADEEQP